MIPNTVTILYYVKTIQNKNKLTALSYYSYQEIEKEK